ncbi:MAG TPA: thiolase family protein [Acidimicrobiia bacterium]|jgi:acetyl-CoA acetyltransferase|nr:thiolase family protein [Acidimicrobiia bacterium]
MREVTVAGVGMTPFGKQSGESVRSLAEAALAQALADSGLTAQDVQTTFFANAVGGLISGQEMIRGQAALRRTGLLGVPMFNVENACASAASAFHLAWMSVAAGACDVAVAVGAEKLTHEDKSRPFRAIGTAVPLDDLDSLRTQLDLADDPEEKRSLFMDIYAVLSLRYMERSGATINDFADVSVKNHLHGSLNPLAQYRNEVTREEVLASRAIVDPLTLMMCAPIGDGAAAAVLCAADVPRSNGRPQVQVRASVVVSGWDRSPGEPGAVERAAAWAYDQAGLGPEDLDVVEVHDAAAPAELMVYEEIGLCPPGEGPALLHSGATRLGGRLPVSPSGGLLAKGHPIGATGLAQIAELVCQLRGEAGLRQVDGARVALAENGGGFLSDDLATGAITILSV